jgi:CBS domain containing-hemolysin-like protein
VVAFGGWTDRMLRAFLPAPARSEGGRRATLERFREVVAAEAGVSREEAVLLSGVFSLGDTAVQDVMVPRVDVAGVEADATWPQVVARLTSARHARLVVYDGTLDEIVGILYAKDCLPAVLSGRPPAGGWHTLVRPASFIPGTKRAEEQLRDFRSSAHHIAIVVDEYGGTAGVVALEDVLELIVGDIRGELEVGEPDVVREDERHMRVSARVTLAELSELTGQDFYRDDVQTVGGLVYEVLGRVPREGEAVTIGAYRVVAERVARRRVKRVRLERVTEMAGDRA